ncbi:MAG TPA: tetratricopeptide repeat protein, partial [Candidatus Edwardsbacteria bacterium]|nr:tetratricopeptide repeat protein [Candidatus Edwardsbacteria bacterium]
MLIPEPRRSYSRDLVSALAGLIRAKTGSASLRDERAMFAAALWAIRWDYGAAAYHAGDYAKVLEIARANLATAHGLDDGRKEAVSMREIGHYFFEVGERPEAKRQYEAALRIYDGLHDDEGVADCLNEIGAVHCAMGERAMAHEAFARTLAIRQSMRDEQGIARALTNIG